MIRPGGRGHEAGAGTLEYVGMTLIAAVLVVALLVTDAGAVMGNSFRAAICTVFSPGESCTLPLTSQSPYEQATSGRYVAMGDSYSSGEGAYDYLPGTDFDDRDDLWPFNDGQEDHNRCHRSTNAYSQIVTQDNTFAGGTDFIACSGATQTQLTDANADNTAENPQLDALGPDVSLITMSLGGNDLGFAAVVQDCILNGERGVPFLDSCQEKHDQRIDDLLPNLQAQLVAQYRRMREESPNARVVIIGYPELFVPEPSDNYGNLLFAEDQEWMNSKATLLNDMLRAAAREAGVEFVDPTAAFRGHGIGSADPWVNDLTLDGPGMMPVDPGSFHPNAQGQAEIARLVQEQLENPQYP